MTTTPIAVRTWPMSREDPEFPGASAEEVQAKYFLRALPTKSIPGMFCWRTKGLNAEPGTVVLFQYDKRIIASAVLEESERFAQPMDYEGILYFGALYLNVGSIRVFDPVGPDTMRRIWPQNTKGFKAFKKFGNVTLSLDPAGYPKFEQGLTGIRSGR